MILPYLNPSLPTQQRIDDLVERMTLDEKIGQLNQIFATPESEERDKEMIRQGQVGSRILAFSAHAGNDETEADAYTPLWEFQRIAVEESRLGIPLIFGRDVIHGHLTVYPIPLAQAASWDIELVEAAAKATASEAVSDFVHWTFAPMLDIARDPRWGRVIEGSGEDPYLCSQMAKAQIRGFQGEDTSAPGSMVACAKHFVGYGAVEGGRDYNTIEVTENTLRNTYLPPFKAAVDAGVGTIMCAFNDWNGIPCSANGYLLNTILRNEWGFDGYVISDWDSIKGMVEHGSVEDAAVAGQHAIQAGVDMEMPGHCFATHLRQQVAEGTVSEATVDQAVRRILRIKFMAGLFEEPFVKVRKQQPKGLKSEHRQLARKLAAESMVLLKNNEDALPLANDDNCTICLIGPLIHARRELLGNWTLDGRPEDTVTIAEGLAQLRPDLKIAPADAAVDAQIRLARKSDQVILVVGEDHFRNGENANIADITLPAGQAQLIDAIHAIGKPIILVVCSGRPLVLTDIEPKVDAILWAWHPGSEGGNAIADILSGNVNPSGKLPITFPRATGQIPIYYNYKNTCRPVDDYYGEDSRYQDQVGKPMYRFGFGLSYTHFEYSNFTLDRSQMLTDECITASIQIKNTGKASGFEVVQCYLRDVVASTIRPVRELKGFQRIHLKSGESKTVQFSFSESDLAFYGADNQQRTEPGEFQLWIGPDSSATIGGKFYFKQSKDSNIATERQACLNPDPSFC
ncbi:glycoside hydrolase family 3 N-terminal domain-containing protein [Cerasicoccus maritimus]|uniref:glycoside hydrolase family 3 N-terminal domain-containing protein n=1 Tax=Cerasicoccus maritimus TaxID=490089 RepID=UPI0028525962|nr:glycoside hydrolase family 3 N-terminal domain-containing protein [Cerasicoccus maritimus]